MDPMGTFFCCHFPWPRQRLLFQVGELLAVGSSRRLVTLAMMVIVGGCSRVQSSIVIFISYCNLDIYIISDLS